MVNLARPAQPPVLQLPSRVLTAPYGRYGRCVKSSDPPGRPERRTQPSSVGFCTFR